MCTGPDEYVSPSAYASTYTLPCSMLMRRIAENNSSPGIVPISPDNESGITPLDLAS